MIQQLLVVALFLVAPILSYSRTDLIHKLKKNIQEYPHDQDVNTYSNYLEVTTNHFDIDWTLDLNGQKVSGSVTLNMTALTNLQQVNLDMWDQEVNRIIYSDQSTDPVELEFEIQHFTEEEEGDQGQQLQIPLSELTVNEGDNFSLEIQYSFGESANAVSFLTKEQTGTKTQPYLYSQCEPIYCRSMMPLQDTPQVKSTYSAQITAHKDLNVYMSGNKTDVQDINVEQRKHFFENQIRIPSYLVAIVAGNVEEQQVGNRTFVIAEPDMIDKSAHDLEDLESYLVTLEDYTQIPYIWGSYKIVIMPPSFPFGGMENPLLTFASPSIITGDKSGTTVAIHEIAHSWTGNMVTCGNWSNMWLNEGFTVFLERKAQMEEFGQDFMIMDSIVGNSSLLADIDTFGAQSNYSSLFPLTAHKNPDDSFSTIPYEKGYQLLYFIQSLIGDDMMQKFLNGWIAENTFKSQVWENVQIYFEDFVNKNIKNPEQIINQVDWNTWVLSPGLPPMVDLVQIHFSSEQQVKSIALCDEWIALRGDSKPANWQDLKKYTPNEKYVFLGHLYDQKKLANPKLLELMQEAYDFNGSTNLELSWRWFEITIYVGYEGAKTPIFNFLGEIGRQKMITPQYAAYVATGQREYAAEVFAYYYDFYHPIARISIENILAE